MEEPYISLIEQGNIVMQVSAVCDKYNKLERGAPPFSERLEMIAKLSKKAKRVIVRVQPYICDVFEDVKKNIKSFAEAGAYGIIFEGMKFSQKQPGTVKVGGDSVIPIGFLKANFVRLREECHNHGLVFLSGENRLRSMGDSLTCCGVEGLEGFKPNVYNLSHMLNGDIQVASEKMEIAGTANAFKSEFQSAGWSAVIARKSFAEMMKYMLNERTNFVKETFGKSDNQK